MSRRALLGVTAAGSALLGLQGIAQSVGGPIRAEVARGQKLVLGDTVVSGPVLFLSQQKTGAFSDPDLAGNVGGGVFLRFNTTFDYARRQIWFERIPTYGFGDGLKLMTVKRNFAGFLVLSVLPGGPMDEAGLKRNDVIELIDYKPAPALRAALSPDEAAEVELELELPPPPQAVSRPARTRTAHSKYNLLFISSLP